jgi:succinoglycan biosynthesis protein ExoA
VTSVQPTVTVVIPALNEEADLRGCLEAIRAQTYASYLVDVVVVDGRSQDRTVEVARSTAAELGLALDVLENPRGRTSISLNVGLGAATGEILVRLDARSRVQEDYVERCVAVLGARTDVGVVGGQQRPRSRSTRLIDRAIARALSNRYTTGFARYRRTTASGPTDTVWMGVFRTEELRSIGGWDEHVALNEDWALNRAYRDAGHIVWFDGSLDSRYLPRPDLASLARQHFYFGRVKGLWWVRGARPEGRQVALLAGPPAAAALVVLSARRGTPWVLAGVPAALLVADAAGSDQSADLAERAVSALAIGVYGASWWTGTLVGAIGEVLGVEHRHAPVPA